MEIRIRAVQFVESFNIKKFRSDFRAEAHLRSPSTVFYAMKNTERYLYIFDYGLLIFANYDAVAKSELNLFYKKLSC